MYYAKEDAEMARNAASEATETLGQISRPTWVGVSGSGMQNAFRCNLCSYECKYQWRMIQHTKIKHLREKPFSCSLCPKKFGVKNDLNRHMLIHMQKKPFTCIYCNKTFRRRWTLKTHLITHRSKILFSSPSRT